MVIPKSKLHNYLSFLHDISMINLVLQVRLKIAFGTNKRPKRRQKAKFIFRDQARKKETKFELFGLQEPNLATLDRLHFISHYHFVSII